MLEPSFVVVLVVFSMITVVFTLAFPLPPLLLLLLPIGDGVAMVVMIVVVLVVVVVFSTPFSFSSGSFSSSSSLFFELALEPVLELARDCCCDKRALRVVAPITSVSCLSCAFVVATLSDRIAPATRR